MRFSMRTLLIALLLLSVPLGWCTRRIQRARRQQEAVEALAPWVPRISYDCDFDVDGKRIKNGKPNAPEWLRDLMGEDCFREVVAIGLATPDDTAFTHLRNFRRLKMIQACSPYDLTDIGLANVKDMPRLEVLKLSCADITDAGLIHLQGLDALRELDISGTLATNAGLKHLSSSTALKVLDLRGTEVTTEGVKKLQGALPNCTINY
jgi:hypothetical protein